MDLWLKDGTLKRKASSSGTPTVAEINEQNIVTFKSEDEQSQSFVAEKSDRSPSASSSSSTTSRTTIKRFPLKHKTHSVNLKSLQPPNTNHQSYGIKDLEIRLLQVECEELKNRLGCLREGLMGEKPSDMEELLKQSQKELLWLQRQLSFISTGLCCGTSGALHSEFRNELPYLQPAVPQKTLDQIRFLEEKTQIFQSNVTTLTQGNHHWRFLVLGFGIFNKLVGWQRWTVVMLLGYLIVVRESVTVFPSDSGWFEKKPGDDDVTC
ncbi:unnamed protein product [Caretta caretta]